MSADPIHARHDSPSLAGWRAHAPRLRLSVACDMLRVNPRLTPAERQPTVDDMAEPTPIGVSRAPRRVDRRDQTRAHRAIGSTHRRRVGRRASRRDRRPPDRAFRRSAPPLGSLLDRHRTSMGVTKQAAQKRFVPRAEATTLDPNQGFGRFTPRARNAVVAAQNAAHDAANAEITPGHLVLGTLSDPAALANPAAATSGRERRGGAGRGHHPPLRPPVG